MSSETHAPDSEKLKINKKNRKDLKRKKRKKVKNYNQLCNILLLPEFYTKSDTT